MTKPTTVEEWLKKNRWLGWKHSAPINNNNKGEPVVSVHALGEWALKESNYWSEEMSRLRKEKCNISRLYNESSLLSGMYYRIAVGCLGEEEVKQKIKEAEK